MLQPAATIQPGRCGAFAASHPVAYIPGGTRIASLDRHVRSKCSEELLMSHSGTVSDTPAVREGDGPEGLVRDDGFEHTAAVARELNVQRFLQPDDVTCGPTCLLKVYDFYGLRVDMDEIVDALERNEDGGTLAVFLGMAARRRGLHARIYSYDLQI